MSTDLLNLESEATEALRIANHALDANSPTIGGLRTVRQNSRILYYYLKTNMMRYLTCQIGPTEMPGVCLRSQGREQAP